MGNMNENTLHISKASFMLAGWGLVIVLGGIVNQWFEMKADFTLLMWAGLTVLGFVAQLVGMVRGLWPNFTIWLVLVIIGWVFTFYVTKFENGIHADLYGDLAGVWLILLGLGYIATAFQVDRRFLIVAGLHLLFGVLLELSARRVVSVDFFDLYSSFIFGLVGGVPLLVAAMPFWYAEQRKTAYSLS